jgi:hypothetical protein
MTSGGDIAVINVCSRKVKSMRTASSVERRVAAASASRCAILQIRANLTLPTARLIVVNLKRRALSCTQTRDTSLLDIEYSVGEDCTHDCVSRAVHGRRNVGRTRRQNDDEASRLTSLWRLLGAQKWRRGTSVTYVPIFAVAPKLIRGASRRSCSRSHQDLLRALSQRVGDSALN